MASNKVPEECKLHAHFGEIVYSMTERLPAYTGEYVVTPLANEDQILPTKDKSLLEDLVVNKIPVYEVSNTYGTTITIGG